MKVGWRLPPGWLWYQSGAEEDEGEATDARLEPRRATIRADGAQSQQRWDGDARVESRTKLTLFVLVLLLAPRSATDAEGAGRVALVVGNSDYAYVGRLPNPRNDATDVRAALRRLGFEVTTVRNAGRAALTRALADFTDRSIGADIALVFYAGHGIEMDGVNYLVPVDARLERDTRVRFETVTLDDVLVSTESAALRLVILDARRKNPLARSMRRTVRTRSISNGSLGELDETWLEAGETLVAYAAAARTTARRWYGPQQPVHDRSAGAPGAAAGTADVVPPRVCGPVVGDRRASAPARVPVSAGRALSGCARRSARGCSQCCARGIGWVVGDRGDAAGDGLLGVHQEQRKSGGLRRLPHPMVVWSLRAARKEPGGGVARHTGRADRRRCGARPALSNRSRRSWHRRRWPRRRCHDRRCPLRPRPDRRPIPRTLVRVLFQEPTSVSNVDRCASRSAQPRSSACQRPTIMSATDRPAGASAADGPRPCTMRSWPTPAGSSGRCWRGERTSKPGSSATGCRCIWPPGRRRGRGGRRTAGARRRPRRPHE